MTKSLLQKLNRQDAPKPIQKKKNELPANSLALKDFGETPPSFLKIRFHTIQNIAQPVIAHYQNQINLHIWDIMSWNWRKPLQEFIFSVRFITATWVCAVAAMKQRRVREKERFSSLKELRGLIQIMAEGGEDAKRKCSPIITRLKRACILGEDKEYSKLRDLSREILNDWDAVVAFVKNPGLPPTNNEAERALRHAVISRRISFGTRTSEGSQAYAALLSVIEICRLRNQDTWSYIAETIRLGRKGIAPPPIPQVAIA